MAGVIAFLAWAHTGETIEQRKSESNNTHNASNKNNKNAATEVNMMNVLLYHLNQKYLCNTCMSNMKSLQSTIADFQNTFLDNA